MSLDIKTSKASTQNIIENWIDNNNNFKEQTWRLNILSKRIISWISNSNLTKVDFTKVDLTGANFLNTNISGAIFLESTS